MYCLLLATRTEWEVPSQEKSSPSADQNLILWLYGVLLFVRRLLQSLSCSLVADKRRQ
jgi:hypothetical protein